MVRLVPLLVLAAGFATPHAARAASPDVSILGPSFTCAAGQDPLAQILCANRDLSRVDLSFVQAYQALWQQSDNDGRQQLRQEAIAFHHDVLSQCGIPTTGSAATLAPTVNSCVSNAYMAERAAWLLRLYPPALEEATRSLEDHIRLQVDLQVLGFLPATPRADGVYGPATRAAIISWQQANGYRADGFLSIPQIEALQLAVGGNTCTGCATKAVVLSEPKAGERNQIQDADLADYGIQIRDWKTYWISDGTKSKSGAYLCVPAVKFTIQNTGKDDLSRVWFSAEFLNESEKSVEGSGDGVAEVVPKGFSAEVVIMSDSGYPVTGELCELNHALADLSVTVKLDHRFLDTRLRADVVVGQSSIARRVYLQSVGRFEAR